MKRSGRINQVSAKRREQRAEYLRRVPIFLVANPICQLCGELPSCEVHHMAGREGPLLLIEKWWRAACRGCHRWATDHKLEAIARGWSLPRTVTARISVSETTTRKGNMNEPTPTIIVMIGGDAVTYHPRDTSAPKDYDGFGTIELASYVYDHKLTRTVLIRDQHYMWQTMRYQSGNHLCKTSEQDREHMVAALWKRIEGR